MSDQEMPANGAFCWNELATTDAGAAKKFYTELLGWNLKESEAAGVAYSEIVVGGSHVGGIYQLTAEQGGMPSHWMAYVDVDDVDASAKRAGEL
ncbi:MAG: VOC family protein, partial [Pyrinomonadaceae bacterium]|nr:VOC family protein [Pyrinomonadaceae bacterium]